MNRRAAWVASQKARSRPVDGSAPAGSVAAAPSAVATTAAGVKPKAAATPAAAAPHTTCANTQFEASAAALPTTAAPKAATGAEVPEAWHTRAAKEEVATVAGSAGANVSPSLSLSGSGSSNCKTTHKAAWGRQQGTGSTQSHSWAVSATSPSVSRIWHCSHRLHCHHLAAATTRQQLMYSLQSWEDIQL